MLSSVLKRYLLGAIVFAGSMGLAEPFIPGVFSVNEAVAEPNGDELNEGVFLDPRIYIEDGKSPVLGKADAPVTIITYFDFECPFSQKVAASLKQIVENDPDNVRVVFKHFPLPMHEHAQLAHQAVEAAKNQKKFWEYFDLLYAN